MTSVFINENKYGFTIKRKNKTNLKFEAQNCICMNPIEKNSSMWFLKIKLPDDIANEIKKIEIECNNTIKNYNLLTSIDENSCINIKIPFRYNKFECDFVNSDDYRIISSDIELKNVLTINIECINIWKNEHCFGLTWKTKFIKKF